MNPKRRRHAAFIEPKMVTSYTVAVLMGVASFMASQKGSQERVEAVQWEAKDHRYVMREKIDSLRTIVREQSRHIRRLEHRVGEVRKIAEVNLTPLGPPEPRKRGVFRRILGFLSAPSEG